MRTAGRADLHRLSLWSLGLQYCGQWLPAVIAGLAKARHERSKASFVETMAMAGRSLARHEQVGLHRLALLQLADQAHPASRHPPLARLADLRMYPQPDRPSVTAMHCGIAEPSLPQTVYKCARDYQAHCGHRVPLPWANMVNVE